MKLQNAYEIFIMLCIEQEQRGLGILRPGILDFLRNVRVKQEGGIVGPVIIYSNNSCLEILEFARDIVHQTVGEVFCALIERNNPIRLLPGHPNPPKTWPTLRKIFMEECNEEYEGINPQPERTLFFDDIIHPNLKGILRRNYIHVPAYEKDIPIEIKVKLYFIAATRARLFDNPEFKDYVKEICRHTEDDPDTFLDNYDDIDIDSIPVNASRINSWTMVNAFNSVLRSPPPPPPPPPPPSSGFRLPQLPPSGSQQSSQSPPPLRPPPLRPPPPTIGGSTRYKGNKGNKGNKRNKQNNKTHKKYKIRRTCKRNKKKPTIK